MHLQVYILSYNRPEYISEAIESVLGQDYPNFELVVSDNSSTDAVERLLKNKDYKLKYIRRKPSLPAASHFNAVIQEASADFVMLFHDDDILSPGALKLMMTELLNCKECVAVSGNAFVLKNSIKTTRLFNSKLKNVVKISTATDLALHYLQSELGHPPFPAYIYCANVLKSVSVEPLKGKKHADVSFLFNVAKRGPLLWLPVPIMYYRQHSGNDSNNIDLTAILSLARFFCRTKLVPLKYINDYRLKHYVLWCLSRGFNLNLRSWRQRVLLKSAVIYLLQNPCLVLNKLLGRLGLK